MDFKDPKTQKILLAAIGLFLVVYFWHAKIYDSYEQKIETRAQQYESIKMELKNVEMKFRTLASLKEEYRALTRRYRSVERLLPEAQSVPDFLTQIHAAAMKSNSQVWEVNPLGVSPEEFYNQDSYNIVMNTTYHDLGRFLADVANFPFIVNVSDLDMQEYVNNRPDMDGQDEYTLTATFNLTTYFVQESEKLVLFDM